MPEILMETKTERANHIKLPDINGIDAEKRAVAAAKQKKLQEIEQQQKTDDSNEDNRDRSERPRHHIRRSEREADAVNNNKENENVNNEANKLLQSKKTKSRPGSGNHSIPKFPGSILHNRDPVYHLHRRERRRRKLKRMTSESDKGSSNTHSLLPRVDPVQPPNTYHPHFHAVITSSSQQNSLPKIAGSPESLMTGNMNNTAYLPSLSQAFVKPAKPTKGHPPASKNVYGRYQLPSIDRRDANF